MWAWCVVRAWCVVWAGLCVGVVLAFCPSGCKCNDQVPSAACVGVGLNVLPILFNPRLRRLNLAHNLLTSIGQGLVFFERLEELDLSHNMLTFLGTDSLEEQRRLRELRLAHNNLTSLAPGAFRGLQHLGLLDLSYNGLNEVPEGVLADTPRLTVLLLAHNRLHVLAQGTFTGVTHSLRLVDLCDNFFREVPSDALSHLQSLKSLHLCRNRLTRIETHSLTTRALSSLSLETNNIDLMSQDAFHQLQQLSQLNVKDNLLSEMPLLPPSLQSLVLSKNNFTVLAVGDFQKLTRLTTLEISWCPHLTQLQPYAFSDCVSLERLTISHNPLLRHLPEHLLTTLPHLTSLDLRGNNLETVAEASVPLKSLQHLDMRENQLVCNCSLRWLALVLGGHNTSIVAPDLQCAAPDKLKGVYLSRWVMFPFSFLQHLSVHCNDLCMLTFLGLQSNLLLFFLPYSSLFLSLLLEKLTGKENNLVEW